MKYNFLSVKFLFYFIASKLRIDIKNIIGVFIAFVASFAFYFTAKIQQDFKLAQTALIYNWLTSDLHRFLFIFFG